MGSEMCIRDRVKGVHRRCKGAYGVVAMINGLGLLAFRDPNGIRPLVYGKRTNDQGEIEYMVASESVALDVIGFELIDDVAPGEAVFIDNDGQLHVQQCADTVKKTPCIFEYVYFARPDSTVEGRNVYEIRKKIGGELARESHPEADLVVPVPDSGVPAAIGYAQESNLPFELGIIRNHYCLLYTSPSPRDS